MNSELIERLEKATGPDRELDGAIAISLGWTLQKMKGDSRAYYRKPGETNYYMRHDPLQYTASIDAALTLVPEAAPNWEIKTASHRKGFVALLFDPKLTFRADAVTPAIALCIAALKARAACSGVGRMG